MHWTGFPSAGELPTLAWSGLFTGVMSGTLAVALVLSFRVSRVINLAVGSFCVIGAFVYAGLVVAGVHPVIAIVFVLLAGAVAGLSEEYFVLRPLRLQPPFTLLLATIGFALLVEGAIIVLRGRHPVSAVALVSERWQLGGLRVTAAQLILFLVGVAITLLIHLWLRYSPSGTVLAATTDDAGAATMMGINVDRLRFYTHGFVGAIGAVIGMLAVPLILLDFASGLPLSLGAFVAAMLGGALSPLGALFGGVALGLVQTFIARMFSNSMAQMLTAALLIGVVLLATRFEAFRALQRT